MPAPDTIADFESGADLIDLSLIDANTALRGRQAFTAVVDQFGGVAGQLQVTRIDGGVILSGDLNRDKVADFAIKVMGVDHLTLSDFIL